MTKTFLKYSIGICIQNSALFHVIIFFLTLCMMFFLFIFTPFLTIWSFANYHSLASSHLSHDRWQPERLEAHRHQHLVSVSLIYRGERLMASLPSRGHCQFCSLGFLESRLLLQLWRNCPCRLHDIVYGHAFMYSYVF